MSAEGNWIHLLYENKIQARRALSRNGRVYNGNMMVGVVPCTDKVVVRADDFMGDFKSNL